MTLSSDPLVEQHTYLIGPVDSNDVHLKLRDINEIDWEGLVHLLFDRWGYDPHQYEWGLDSLEYGGSARFNTCSESGCDRTVAAVASCLDCMDLFPDRYWRTVEGYDSEELNSLADVLTFEPDGPEDVSSGERQNDDGYDPTMRAHLNLVVGEEANDPMTCRVLDRNGDPVCSFKVKPGQSFPSGVQAGDHLEVRRPSRDEVEIQVRSDQEDFNQLRSYVDDHFELT